jgi:pseudouridine-5'-phosphate glycosidase/pseudouridine kinase
MWSGNSRAIISAVARTRRGFTTGTHDFRYDPRVFRVSEEVRNAVASGNPVVALESTIYTHGFPYPDNVSLASDLEDIIRQNGGVPATIGLLSGVARVGLDAEELVELASSAGKAETMKVSRRDLAYIAGLVSRGKFRC